VADGKVNDGVRRGQRQRRRTSTDRAEIVIGATLPLTGAEARIGGFHKEGYELAFDEMTEPSPPRECGCHPAQPGRATKRPYASAMRGCRSSAARALRRG